MQKFKTVDEFLNSLEHGKRKQVDALRDIIVHTEPNLTETIKWNAPNYAYEGEDRITFNVMNKQGIVQLVLHMGVSRKENKKGEPVLHDTTSLIEWNSDIRGMLKFVDLDDIKSKKDDVRSIITNWLAIKP